MMTLITFTLFFVVITLLLAGYVAIHYTRYRIDVSRIAGAYAVTLIDRHAEDVLSEDGTKKLARQHYLQMCGAFGLPESATDTVANEVWRLVSRAQGTDEANYE